MIQYLNVMTPNGTVSQALYALGAGPEVESRSSRGCTLTYQSKEGAKIPRWRWQLQQVRESSMKAAILKMVLFIWLKKD